MDEIKKYDGSVCKEGYYRFQTRNWFDLDRMRTADNAEQCFALVEELRTSGKHVLDESWISCVYWAGMTLSRWACGTLTAQDMLLSKHSPFKIVSKLEEAQKGFFFNYIEAGYLPSSLKS